MRFVWSTAIPCSCRATTTSGFLTRPSPEPADWLNSLAMNIGRDSSFGGPDLNPQELGDTGTMDVSDGASGSLGVW